MADETSARHALPYLAAGQAQKELTHNEALALIDAGLHPAVVSAGVNTPPADPEPGQCWLLGSTPTSEWADHGAALACWTSGGWRFLPAIEGMCVWVIDQQLWGVYEASGWQIGKARAGEVSIGGQQVVGARLSGVPTPSGGTTIDVEGRAALAAIIDRLATHGLIAA